MTPEIRIEGTAADPAQRAQHRLRERGDELLAELTAKVTLVTDLQLGLGDREAARETLTEFCTRQVVRYLLATDRVLYSVAAGAAETRLLVRALRAQHDLVAARIAALKLADSSAEVAASAHALVGLLEVCQHVERKVLIPEKVAGPPSRPSRMGVPAPVLTGSLEGTAALDSSSPPATWTRSPTRPDLDARGWSSPRAGARDSYLDHPEWAEHLYPMKTLAAAIHLRNQVFAPYERAADCDDPVKRAWLTTFAIVGAGPTSVEIASQLASLARELRPESHPIDSTRPRIVLIEAIDEVLTSFPPSLRAHTSKRLAAMGVDTLLDARAEGIDADGIAVKTTDGQVERLDTHTVIWAAGVRPSPLAEKLATASGADSDRKKRVWVRPDGGDALVGGNPYPPRTADQRGRPSPLRLIVGLEGGVHRRPSGQPGCRRLRSALVQQHVLEARRGVGGRSGHRVAPSPPAAPVAATAAVRRCAH